MTHCPDAQWRLLVALSRYGGLRIPSEALPLKWSDVNWEKSRIIITSPKTEHHEGKGGRVIPLFPELRKPLLDVFEDATSGAEFVLTRYRDAAVNLRTHFMRIIRQAGLKPWPKPWHNMRASRQTELAERFPIHVVCAWLGNTRAVAQEHYLQVTDAHFEGAAQNAAQQTSEMAGNEPQLVGTESEKGPEFPSDSEPCETSHNDQYPRQESNL